MSDRPTIVVPNMCQKHQRLLVQQLGLGPNDTWRAAIVMAQIVLFQAATAHPSTYERIGGDITRISELGCLACDRPDAFGEIIETTKTKGFGAVKALGESYLKSES